MKYNNSVFSTKYASFGRHPTTEFPKFVFIFLIKQIKACKPEHRSDSAELISSRFKRFHRYFHTLFCKIV